MVSLCWGKPNCPGPPGIRGQGHLTTSIQAQGRRHLHSRGVGPRWAGGYRCPQPLGLKPLAIRAVMVDLPGPPLMEAMRIRFITAEHTTRGVGNKGRHI